MEKLANWPVALETIFRKLKNLNISCYKLDKKTPKYKNNKFPGLGNVSKSRRR
jgi:hypothetical protein